MRYINWRVLGLTATRDELEIRRAYAEALKTCNPEESPDRWRELHTAYRAALEYARGDEDLPASEDPLRMISRDLRETEPTSSAEQADLAEQAAAFERALQRAEQQAGSSAYKTRFPRVRRARDVPAFGEALEALPLREISEDLYASVCLAMISLRTEKMSREAGEAVRDLLLDTAEGMPLGLIRQQVEKKAAELTEWLSRDKLPRDFFADARRAFVVALLCSVLLVLQPSMGSLHICVIVAGLCGVYYALTHRWGGVPRPERLRDISRNSRICAWLFVAAFILMQVTYVSALILGRDGFEPTTYDVTAEAVPFETGLEDGTLVTALVAEPPEYLATCAPFVEVPLPTVHPIPTVQPAPTAQDTQPVRTHVYQCVLQTGASILLCVEQEKLVEWEHLVSQGTFSFWGKICSLPAEGSYEPEKTGRPTVEGLETSLALQQDVRHRASELGENAVVRYLSSEPVVETVTKKRQPKDPTAFIILGGLHTAFAALVLTRVCRRWV